MMSLIDSVQEWITLEDYCLERDVVLDHCQLIKEGLAIARHLRTNGLPPPHKVRHDRYGLVNGYRRCTLDEWYEEFVAQRNVSRHASFIDGTHTATVTLTNSKS